MSFVSRLINPNPPSPIRSIQRGRVVVPEATGVVESTSGLDELTPFTVNIAAVDLARSVVVLAGARGFGGTYRPQGNSVAIDPAYGGVTVELSSSTTLRIRRSWGTVRINGGNNDGKYSYKASGGELAYQVVTYE